MALKVLELSKRGLPPWMEILESYVRDGPPSEALPQENASALALLPDAEEEFGKEFGKKHFRLNLGSGEVYLNHGGYGAALRVCLESQTHWRDLLESNPTEFMEVSLEAQLALTIREIARFINADPSSLVFVPSTTVGINTIFNSLKLSEEDSVIFPSSAYLACKNVISVACARAGAKAIEFDIKYPIQSEDDIVQAVEAAILPSTKCLLMDHITSPAGVVYPIKRIIDLCRSKGILVIVDGAHALGQIPVDIEALDPDFYVTNAHKWLCTAKGAALLYVRESHQDKVKPCSVSHGLAHGFVTEFTWAGTADYTPFLTVLDALRFHKRVGPKRLMDHNHALVLYARETLSKSWNTASTLLCPQEMNGSMVCVGLPKNVEGDLFQLREKLNRERLLMAPFFEQDGVKYVRVSCQVYNTKDDIDKLNEIMLSL